MILAIYSEPAIEPVSIDTAKTHLRVTHNDDDAHILALITAARKYVETYLGRALITQTWDMWLDRFPYSDESVDIGKAPLQSVTAITYVDTTGNTQTLSSTVYTVDADSEPGRVYLAPSQTWPRTREQRKAVKIRYVAGYGNAESDVPAQIVQSILLMVSHFYELREPTIIGAISTTAEMSVDALLTPYRITYL